MTFKRLAKISMALRELILKKFFFRLRGRGLAAWPDDLTSPSRAQ